MKKNILRYKVSVIDLDSNEIIFNQNIEYNSKNSESLKEFITRRNEISESLGLSIFEDEVFLTLQERFNYERKKIVFFCTECLLIKQHIMRKISEKLDQCFWI